MKTTERADLDLTHPLNNRTLTVLTQPETEGHFPSGMNFAVGNSAYGVLEWFVTFAQADAWRARKQQDIDAINS